MLGRNEDGVMDALVRNRHIREVQRLGIDVSIYRVGDQFVEGARVTDRGCEDGFARVLSVAIIVVLLSTIVYIISCIQIRS